tara:strand:+ start:131 stop:349 length:219 start_codon:yes stop_codon:yes gene_type:complete
MPLDIDSSEDPGGDLMIKWLARWILRQEINDIEHDCWHDGVNQQRYDPKSAEHGLKSFSMYWYGIEGEGEEE